MTTLALAFFAAVAAAPPEMTIRGEYVAGDELRLIIATAKTKKSGGPRSADALDEQGWLLSINLAKPGPLAARSKVTGPLWTVAGPQSTLTFHHGISFDAKDAAAAKRSIGFDDLGQLIRQRRVPIAAPTEAPPKDGVKETSLILERFDLAASPMSWIKVADAQPIGQVGDDPYEGRLRSDLARMFVQEEADGRVRAYDSFTGAPRQDAWLTTAFADLRAREDFHNTKTWLTDDLKYIVSRPEEGHNTGSRMIESFILDGKTYSRAQYGLIYTRPNAKPAVFKKPTRDVMFLMAPPHGAYSYKGELLLFEVGDSTLSLSTPEGAARFEWPRHDKPTWEVTNTPSTQFDPVGDRLIIFNALNDPAKRKYADRYFTVTTWSFKAGSLKQDALDLAELFDVKDGAYIPRSAEK